MSGEDVELRDLLIQTLELNGSLAKCRAQLRANIFKTLSEDHKIENQLVSDKLKSYCENSEGQAMFYVVRDFLQYFGLDYTLSVFEQESRLCNYYNEEKQLEIFENFGLDSKNNQSSPGPVLLKLLQSIKDTSFVDVPHTPVILNNTYDVDNPIICVKNDKTEEKVPNSHIIIDKQNTEAENLDVLNDKISDLSLDLQEQELGKSDTISEESNLDNKESEVSDNLVCHNKNVVEQIENTDATDYI